MLTHGQVAEKTTLAQEGSRCRNNHQYRAAAILDRALHPDAGRKAAEGRMLASHGRAPATAEFGRKQEGPFLCA
jgi:hypothetical protein